ncbi:hypothetical protein DFH11DRAFT_1256791 [Phellopilus nigrolimitatus]|nr:hypothetical protein DFH11DRAFT_1256791 [Phellopilus nigrolimitatus]
MPPVDRNNSKNSSTNGGFKIYPNAHVPNAFIYERSENESDTLTSYSTSSLDTTTQSMTTATSTTVSRPEPPGRRNSVLMITNPGPGDAMTSSSAPSPPDSPLPLPASLPMPSSSVTVKSQGRPLPRGGEDLTRPRSGSGDSGSSRRRGSGSDSEKPLVFPPGPSASRPSPPKIGTGPSVRFTGSAPRDVPPPRRDDSRMQVDAPRSRRLSGPVIPPGFGPGERHSPTNGRDIAVSGDSKRERYSPDRDTKQGPEMLRERRPSNAAALPPPPSVSSYDRDRTRLPQPSGSSPTRDRHSPQEEMPRGAGFQMGPSPAATIRSRTLSIGRREDAPRQIVIAGVEASALAQGPCRTVRFSERLICPSPVPLDRRRKGWFNKKGDQLWTNDGVFVPPDPGTEYPVDLNEYPDVGAGWMNEECIRIDMQHRLVPKAPLRPALKRSNTSGSSGSSQQQQMVAARPENRAFYSGVTIHEE